MIRPSSRDLEDLWLDHLVCNGQPFCVMVQLDKVEVCELKPKMLTKDKGSLV